MKIEKLLKRKVFKDVLGDNYILSPNQIMEMNKFLETSHAKNNNSFIRVRYFILYELDNYVERYEKSVKCGKGLTYEKLVICYGEEQANKRWKEYKEKQAYSNTFEYKKEKYGWSKKQYDEYNKSRSVTLDNLILKHGKSDGLLKWEEYCQKQKYSNTVEYFIKKYNSKDIGTKEWLKYNYSKGSSNRIDDIMKKYSFSREEACEYISKKRTSSLVSTSEKRFVDYLFSELGYDLKYSYKTRQYCIWCNDLNCPVFYDIVDTNSKVIIEYNGDIWHANPKKYKSTDIIPIINKEAKEIWDYDNKKTLSALDRGFDVIKVWESDFLKNPKNEVEKVIKWLKK